MYKRLDLYRYIPNEFGPRKILDMVVIGYWEPEDGGPAIVRNFRHVDEHMVVNRQDSRVIGRALEDVIKDQEGCGFER